MEVKHRCNQIMELGFPLGGIAKLFAQAWEGDITVVMPATLAQMILYSKIIQNPSYGELQKAANQGRRCTWEKLSAIKANCGIELALDECVAILNHMRRLKRSAQRAAAAAAQNQAPTFRFNASRRIPSWNCIAREGSTGSLDEELLIEVASLHQLGNPSGAGSSPRPFRAARNTQDGSDSEPESTDVNNTWTRSGGPLMRTASANKFVEFVLQNLDLNPLALQMAPLPRDLRVPDRGSESAEFDQRTSSGSIMVTEGDLLQPERTHNGIVFNVVKMEDLTVPGHSHDSESGSNSASSAAECMQLECPGDGSTASESDHEDDNSNDEDNPETKADAHSDSLQVSHPTETVNAVVGSDASPET